jgi:hypothetical protein
VKHAVFFPLHWEFYFPSKPRHNNYTFLHWRGKLITKLPMFLYGQSARVFYTPGHQAGLSAEYFRYWTPSQNFMKYDVSDSENYHHSGFISPLEVSDAKTRGSSHF